VCTGRVAVNKKGFVVVRVMRIILFFDDATYE